MRNGFIYFIGLLSIALLINVLFMATIVSLGNTYVAATSAAQSGLVG